MKRLVVAITLLICMTVTLCFANSCGDTSDKDNNDKDSSTPPSESQSDTEEDFGITEPENDDRAILHMIKEVDALEGWQAGKTEFNARYYIDDMMDILDGLDWSNADLTNLSGDFDFRIDLYRTYVELEKFEQFTVQADTTLPFADTEETESDTDEIIENQKYAVQYLINYDDRIVNMRLTDYSAQKFDLYAELNETEMKMIVLCLKYYFGPST